MREAEKKVAEKSNHILDDVLHDEDAGIRLGVMLEVLCVVLGDFAARTPPRCARQACRRDTGRA